MNGQDTSAVFTRKESEVFGKRSRYSQRFLCVVSMSIKLVPLFERTLEEQNLPREVFGFVILICI